tara:strand:- start:2329 stop:2661 length:333 start_codon:yes stop_codon:yes gene_type:complete
MGQEGMSATMWRDFNTETVMHFHKAWGMKKIIEDKGPSAPANEHRAFMAACIEGSRGVGNAAYCRAIAPFWDARDIAFYFWGVSPSAAMAEGYKAMQTRYNTDAPAWAWW